MTTTDTIPPTATKSNGHDHDEETTPADEAPLGTKERRSAMSKCMSAVDNLSDGDRARVIRALAALFGVECP